MTLSSRETSRRAEKMLRDFFQIILIVALSLMFRSISSCPSPCACKWKVISNNFF